MDGKNKSRWALNTKGFCMRKNWFYEVRAFWGLILSGLTIRACKVLRNAGQAVTVSGTIVNRLSSSMSAVCFMAALTGLLIGCTTYKGQYDTSVPLDEQSILKVSGNLFVISFDDDSLTAWSSGNVVNIPSGTHTLVFTYSNKVKTGEDANYTYYETTTLSDIQLTMEFLAGHSYTTSAREGGGKIYVTITEDKEGSSDDTSTKLRGPKYTKGGSFISPDFRFGGYLNLLGVGGLSETGVFVDGDLPWAAYLDYSFGYNLFRYMGVELWLGAFGEIYPLKNGEMGFGLGTGFNILGDIYVKAAFIQIREQKNKVRYYLQLDLLPKPREYMGGGDKETSVLFGGGVEYLF
jgi:hypothetical protein